MTLLLKAGTRVAATVESLHRHECSRLGPRCRPSYQCGPALQVGTWINGFHFEMMPDESLHRVRSSLRMLVFPGTSILHMPLQAASIPSDPPPSLWTVRCCPLCSSPFADRRIKGDHASLPCIICCLRTSWEHSEDNIIQYNTIQCVMQR